VDDRAPASTGTGIAANNKGWAFVETGGVVSTDNFGITIDILGDYGFAKAVLSSNNNG
jgi:hypothetical protein